GGGTGGGGDEAVPVDRRRGGSDQQIRVVHDVRVARAAHAGDEPVFYADARLHHAQHRVDDDHVGDEQVELARRRQAVAHHEAGAHGLAPPAQDLVAVPTLVPLDQRHQVRVAEADPVAG